MIGIFPGLEFRLGIADGGGGHAAVGGSVSDCHGALRIFQTGGFYRKLCRTVLLFLHSPFRINGEDCGIAALKGQILQFALADFHIITVIEIHRRLCGGLGFEAEIVHSQFEALVAAVRTLIHAPGNFDLHVFGRAGFGGGICLFRRHVLRQLHQIQLPVVFVGAVLQIYAGQTRMGEVAIQQMFRRRILPLGKHLFRLGVASRHALRHGLTFLQALAVGIGRFIAGQIRTVVIKEHKQFTGALQRHLFQIGKHGQFLHAVLSAKLVDLLKQRSCAILIGSHLKRNGERFGFGRTCLRYKEQAHHKRAENSDDSAKHRQTSSNTALLCIYHSTILRIISSISTFSPA